MATFNYRAANADHKDIYSEVNDYVIAALEKGDIIWQKPWHGYGLPRNITGETPYRGWNAFLLNFVSLFKEYATPYYITFLQAQQLGGSIRKGEKGYRIIFMAPVKSKYHSRTVRDEATGIERQVPEMIRVPKMHTVFNIAQTEGIEFQVDKPTERTHIQKIAACEEIIAGMPKRPPITHKGDQACYVPSLDEVFMPAQSLFHNDEGYYSTLFHELAHSTGHISRLNREELMTDDSFGGKNYSKEELTAELTAAYLSGVTGIQQATIDNSAAYIKGWLHKLRDDKRFFLNAASQARAACEFILNNCGQAVLTLSEHQSTNA
ncbi:ArdC family protein [Niastella sp. OAS944]|uniref:ArdC family protein n=1 Tax=Niastella sp. OAS944 TaxID=2664089 RepID=UPI003474AB1C|nr:antirestriction protein ArdC [Chitinophagaceae bacterium OAS944]